jgi:hypothetical protein
MAREQYFVVFDDDQWKIKHNDRHSEAYPTQAAAIKKAVALAQADGEGGRDSQVMVQGRDLLFKAEWTYGHDPYPPRG